MKRRFQPSRGRWTFPGGIVELGEGVVEAVKREVLEEVGLEIEVKDLIDVVDNIMRDEDGAIRYHYILIDFLAYPVRGVLKADKEALELKWFRREELINLDLTKSVMKLLKKIGFLG